METGSNGHRSCPWSIPPGYTDDAVSAAGGNPYGTAHRSDDGLPTKAVLAAASYQGGRLARVTAALRGADLTI